MGFGREGEVRMDKPNGPKDTPGTSGIRGAVAMLTQARRPRSAQDGWGRCERSRRAQLDVTPLRPHGGGGGHVESMSGACGGYCLVC